MKTSDRDLGGTVAVEAPDLTLLDLHPAPDDFLGEVVAGLSDTPKHLPCKFFYDKHGSKLFDRICELDEYYPTRTEMAIMEERIDDIAAGIGPQAALIEFGSGSSLKTRVLLDHLEDPVAYVPIDISREHLIATARDLQEAYPDIEILPVCADYTNAYQLPTPKRLARRKVVYFPGSTIGNFSPAEALDFLRKVAKMAGIHGGFLLGFDLRKERAVLERAYNDAEGVTAAFNLNLLHRIRRELGAELDVDAFAHEVVYDAELGRIEMHLVSQRDQAIVLGDQRFELRAGERIHTENSHKYTLDGMAAMAEQAGFCFDHSWVDERKYFCVGLLSACS